MFDLLTSRNRFGSPDAGRSPRWSRAQGWSCMALVLGVLLGLAAAEPARAQVGGLNWQCVAGDPTKACPVSSTYPLPVSQGTQALVPVAGTQRGVTISASTGMTIPAGATTALVQAQGTNTMGGICLFWQDDGTAPTGTAGIALAANNSILVSAIAAFKMIAATGATCTASIAYYK